MAMQMTCPYCKKEFPYEDERTDKRLAELGNRITTINIQLQRFKILPKHLKTKETWKERQLLINELNRLKAEQVELKHYRRQGEWQKERISNDIFKSIVKEMIGEKKYMEIWGKVNEEMKAYEISDLMKHGYSRASSKSNVTSINKV